MAEGLFAIDILKCNLTVKKKKLNQNTTLEFYQSIVIKVRYVFHLIQLGLKKNLLLFISSLRFRYLSKSVTELLLLKK